MIIYGLKLWTGHFSMRKLGISLLITSISENLIFNRLFVTIIKHSDLKWHKITEVKEEQIIEGRLQLYRVLFSLFLSELEDQCDLIGWWRRSWISRPLMTKLARYQVIPGNDQITTPTNQGATGIKLDQTRLADVLWLSGAFKKLFRWFLVWIYSLAFAFKYLLKFFIIKGTILE